MVAACSSETVELSIQYGAIATEKTIRDTGQRFSRKKNTTHAHTRNITWCVTAQCSLASSCSFAFLYFPLVLSSSLSWFFFLLFFFTHFSLHSFLSSTHLSLILPLSLSLLFPFLLHVSLSSIHSYSFLSTLLSFFHSSISHTAFISFSPFPFPSSRLPFFHSFYTSTPSIRLHGAVLN
jgi:hypothetical protein